MKVCKICKIPKELTEFYRHVKYRDHYRPICKNCFKESKKAYQKNNPTKAYGYIRKWKKNNPEKTRKYAKKWRKKHPEKSKEYYLKYRVKILKRLQNNSKIRYKNDYLYKLKKLARDRLRLALKSKKWLKKSSYSQILGCSPVELKGYLENRFKSGMTWENHGKWHIDHIIPLSSAKTPEELYNLCHYTNLQPLWAEENRKKSNRTLT